MHQLNLVLAVYITGGPLKPGRPGRSRTITVIIEVRGLAAVGPAFGPGHPVPRDLVRAQHAEIGCARQCFILNVLFTHQYRQLASVGTTPPPSLPSRGKPSTWLHRLGIAEVPKGRARHRVGLAAVSRGPHRQAGPDRTAWPGPSPNSPRPGPVHPAPRPSTPSSRILCTVLKLGKGH